MALTKVTGKGLETLSDGVTITTADNTSQLTLTSTDADASNGPRLDLKRDSGSPADGDNLGRIRYMFDNDAAEQTEGVRLDAVLDDASDSTEDVSYEISTIVAGTLTKCVDIKALGVAIPVHASIGADAAASTRALTVAGATDGSSSSTLVCYNSSLSALFSVRDDGFVSANGTLDLNGQLDLDVPVATNPALSVTHTGSGNSTLAIFTQSASNAYNMAEWRTSDNTGVLLFGANGNITNTNNSYGAISDEKLKENIADANSQWEDIKAVKVRKYSLKTESSETANQLGVVAQELETSGMNGLVVDSVDRDPDTFEDLGTTTKQVKYSVLYMKAVKALQEAMTRIETLEAKVTALESA